VTRRVIILALVAAGLVAYAIYRVRLARAPFEWSGTVEARTMDLGSHVGGRIERVLAREGDTVTAGQPLLILEKGDLPAQRLQAQGQLEQAEAALRKLAGRNLPTARKAEIAAAQARVAAQQAQVEKAQQDQARMQKLLAAGAATRADADNAATALRNATAQTAALQAQLDQLLHGTPQDVLTAQGMVDAARGRLQQVDVQLGELTVLAPRRARVEVLDLRPGDILAPNATAARLLEPDQLYVRIYVPETELGHIRPGLAVPIYVDSFPGRAFRGQVESVASEGEYTPRNLQTSDERADQVFAARVRIEPEGDLLRAGMAAFVRVPRQ
jgi:multidrug resistance efflux pump